MVNLFFLRRFDRPDDLRRTGLPGSRGFEPPPPSLNKRCSPNIGLAVFNFLIAPRQDSDLRSPDGYPTLSTAKLRVHY